MLIVEEAQDLNTTALEELRLLTTARADTQSPFSLLLAGDEDLLPRLDLDAHIFITELAYQLLRFITYTLEQKGDHRDWPTLRRVLETHCYATVSMPTRHGTVVHVRRAGAPVRCHQEIYEKLGINWKELPTKKITVAMKTPATL